MMPFSLSQAILASIINKKEFSVMGLLFCRYVYYTIDWLCLLYRIIILIEERRLLQCFIFIHTIMITFTHAESNTVEKFGGSLQILNYFQDQILHHIFSKLPFSFLKNSKQPNSTQASIPPQDIADLSNCHSYFQVWLYMANTLYKKSR